MTDWPSVDDGDSPTQRLRRQVRVIRTTVVILVIGQALITIGFLWLFQLETARRNDRFCALVQQSVVNASNEQPVSQALIVAGEAVGCKTRIPPGTIVEIG